MAKAKKAGEEIVKVCRRTKGERRGAKATQTEVKPEQPAKERRTKVQRRRQIDPTTCERDYSGDEIEFMRALDEYKRANGRMFPTCSEILEVVRSLGYSRTTDSPEMELEEQVEEDVAKLTVAVAEAVDANAVDFDLDHDEF